MPGLLLQSPLSASTVPSVPHRRARKGPQLSTKLVPLYSAICSRQQQLRLPPLRGKKHVSGTLLLLVVSLSCLLETHARGTFRRRSPLLLQLHPGTPGTQMSAELRQMPQTFVLSGFSCSLKVSTKDALLQRCVVGKVWTSPSSFSP